LRHLDVPNLRGREPEPEPEPLLDADRSEKAKSESRVDSDVPNQLGPGRTPGQIRRTCKKRQDRDSKKAVKGKMSTGGFADVNRRVDCNRRVGCFRPEGWSMPIRSLIDVVPTERVDVVPTGRVDVVLTGRVDVMPTERVDVVPTGRVNVVPTGRVDVMPTEGSMPTKCGRCRPEGSMQGRPRVVDADWKGRCEVEQEWSTPTKVGRCRPARSKLQRIPTRSEKPERQTVGTSEEAGISESTGTKNNRRSDSSGKHRNTEAPSGRRRNTEEPKLPTRSETPEVRLERKISRNRDIRKKESRRPMRNRRPERMSKMGSRNQAAEDASKAWSLEGPEPKSRSALRASN
jgi:hypothetical protein